MNNREAATFSRGELFVYVNGDCWELGMVKRPNNTGDGYFCWYSTGDTAANTPTRCMHKLANHGLTKVEGLLREATNGIADADADGDLLPCPFCGGPAEVNRVPFIGVEGDGLVATCNRCRAKTGYYNTRHEAITAWNRRAG